MIEARNLTKTFKDKKRGVITAVNDISFTCRPGAGRDRSAPLSARR